MLKPLKIYYIFVALPFVLLLTGAAIFHDAIMLTITRNPHPQINYTIFVIILSGGALILLNARRLIREAGVLVEFSRAIHAKMDLATLKKMANRYVGDISCLLQMVAASSGRPISHQEQVAIEHELTNARARLIRRNSLPQYLTGLLVGMGLLGTFIGLLATLNDISVLISSFADLDMKNASPLLVFRTMIERMKAPMQSMGIAFSASMFGLLGSIILGLMMVGLRRLQGDIFSLLSSEVARHIEIALSQEKVAFNAAGGEAGEVAKVLFRIEERYAEAARSQQRTLATVVDDLKEQRSEMLRVLNAQTEASEASRTELQELGRRLGGIFEVMEQGRGEVSSQISDLTVHVAGTARENQRLLSAQVDEQKKLRETLDAFNLEERLTEALRQQQRGMSSQLDEFKAQRDEMQRTLAEQTEASQKVSGELQQLVKHFATVSRVVENEMMRVLAEQSEASHNVRAELQQVGAQLGAIAHTLQSDLMRTLADQAGMSNGIRSELQQVGGQIGTLSTLMEKEMCGALSEQAATGRNIRSELQQLGHRLGTLAAAVEKGDGELVSQVSELTVNLSGDAKDARNLLTMQVEEQKGLREALDSYRIEERLAEATRLQQRALAQEMDDFKKQRADMLRTLSEQIEASNNFRRELQQVGGQLATIFEVMEKGKGEISTQISELMVHRAADARESHKLLSMLVSDQEPMVVNDQNG